MNGARRDGPAHSGEETVASGAFSSCACGCGLTRTTGWRGKARYVAGHQGRKAMHAAVTVRCMTCGHEKPMSQSRVNSSTKYAMWHVRDGVKCGVYAPRQARTVGNDERAPGVAERAQHLPARRIPR